MTPPKDQNYTFEYVSGKNEYTNIQRENVTSITSEYLTNFYEPGWVKLNKKKRDASLETKSEFPIAQTQNGQTKT